MIILSSGNLLNDNSIALVNTVNTVGVMGKGIAKLFKDAFPENYNLYKIACKKKEIHIGKMFVTSHIEFFTTKWIVNFPTKIHWRNPSKIEWIDKGLEDLRQFISCNTIPSIALPALGCGNGELNWKDVHHLIHKRLSDLNITINLYKPV